MKKEAPNTVLRIRVKLVVKELISEDKNHYVIQDLPIVLIEGEEIPIGIVITQLKIKGCGLDNSQITFYISKGRDIAITDINPSNICLITILHSSLLLHGISYNQLMST